MAEDDAGTGHAPDLAASENDQSLSTATTATASAERRPSDPFNAAVESNQPTEVSHVDAVAVELAELRHELSRVRLELEQEAETNDVDRVDDSVVEAATVQTDAIEHRVLKLGGGVYRGQVRLKETDVWLPHGLGVLATAAGHTLSGQWLNGRQVGCGTHYSPILHYEGDVDTPVNGQRYGVGLYTFGALFAGCWYHEVASVHLCPRGLGRLQRPAASNMAGWFNGLRFVHANASEVDEGAFKTSSNVRTQSQPTRGLLVADEKLQFWRRRALSRALSSWSRLCCDFAMAKATRNRLLALEVLQQARRAEQHAIRENLETQKALERQSAVELLAQLAKAQDAQDRRKQRRQLHVQRVTRAIEQRDLAQTCVIKQRAAVTILEEELQGIVELLEEARQAQEDCARYTHELHVFKRQIENASVKLNAIRFGDQRTEDRLGNAQESKTSPTLRSVLPTPAKFTPRQREGTASVEYDEPVPRSRGGTSHRNVIPGQQFVCDVPGCSCGIPRDVFLRVAAALKDE